MSKRVIAAMSGGVDSSVCAALLVEQGYEVIGITMRLGHHDSVEPDADKPTCCGLDGINDARRVASQLGIPYYALNYENIFAKSVVDYFTDEYLHGRTPNPCVLCNQELKFGKLLYLCAELGAEFVATGHYARVQPRDGRHAILRGCDLSKDQSYFLFSLTQEQLARTMMPLGGLEKSEVRTIARKYDLITADKPESQEICFIADDDYKRFLKERVPESATPGRILDKEGNVLGRHEGTPFYTVGQRRGLGISANHPLYVTEIHTPDNVLIVGKNEDLLASEVEVERVNWVSLSEPQEPIRARVKIRYKDAGEMATVTPLPNRRAWVAFDAPRRAITPGQAAVFYEDDTLLGGGWIV